MEVRAYQKYIRVSPRKLRLVADAVRNMPPNQALTNLKFMNKRAAVPLAKIFKQAISNAQNNLNLKEADLKTKELLVEEGPTLKRWRAVSRGRAHQIMKRTSHLKLILEYHEPKKKPQAKTDIEKQKTSFLPSLPSRRKKPEAKPVVKERGK